MNQTFLLLKKIKCFLTLRTVQVSPSVQDQVKTPKHNRSLITNLQVGLFAHITSNDIQNPIKQINICVLVIDCVKVHFRTVFKGSQLPIKELSPSDAGGNCKDLQDPAAIYRFLNSGKYMCFFNRI
ncbi:hypothetical protein FKM82_000691 [Ascaphus truei]